MKRSIVALAALAILSAAAAASNAAYAAKDSMLGAAMLGAAPERGTGLPSGQCLRSRDIRNHTIADRNTLLIKGGDKQTYRVTMADGCLAGANESDPIITRNPPGASRGVIGGVVGERVGSLLRFRRSQLARRRSTLHESVRDALEKQMRAERERTARDLRAKGGRPLFGRPHRHGYVKRGCPLTRLGGPYASSDPLGGQDKPTLYR